jgi:hypothetical protein
MKITSGGPENSQRVTERRIRNPGYWRRTKPAAKKPLQDLCSSQVAHNEEVTEKASKHALQDLLLTEAAVIVGLISTMTGDALQDDIATTVRALRRRGQDILRRMRS